MIRAFLLRHGRTQANVDYVYCGRTDLPLSAEGVEALKELRDRCIWPDISGFKVYTSGMRRTEETLTILYGNVDHRVVPGLREMDFGEFEMFSYEQLKDDPEYRQWCSGDNDRNLTPGGESGELMRRRVMEAFHTLLSRKEDFLAVCHGGPIAAIMAEMFPDEDKNRFQWQPKNGCGYMLELDGTKSKWYSVPAGGENDV